MLANEPYIFNTTTPYIVKEGLSFWTSNSYRNYYTGVTTVPEFIDEYMPQQTHFDALFHMLFYKKLVPEAYLIQFKSNLDDIVEVINRSEPQETPISLEFPQDIEKGLGILRKWYMLKTEFNVGYIDTNVDYEAVLKLLKTVGKEEAKTELSTPHLSVTVTSNDSEELVTIFVSSSDVSNSTTVYEDLITNSTRKRLNSPSFLKNVSTVSGEKHKGSINKVSVVSIGDITKTLYQGFDAPSAYNLNYASRKTFKCIFEIPIQSYKIKLKNKEKGDVASTLIDNVVPTCSSTGQFLIGSNRWSQKLHIGSLYFDIGHLPLDNKKVTSRSIGGKKVVFIDHDTAKLLGGDETVVYAEIEPIEYLYNQDIFSTKNIGFDSHYHFARVPVSSGYFKGKFNIANPFCGQRSSSKYGNSYGTYRFNHTWNFDASDFRNDAGTSYRKDYAMRMEGEALDGTINYLHAKTFDYYLKVPGTCGNGDSSYFTRYARTRMSSDKMFQARVKDAYASTADSIHQTSQTDYINNIVINLTVYDPIASIGKALIDDGIDASGVDSAL